VWKRATGGVSSWVTHIEFRCSPYHQNSAFYLLIDRGARQSQGKKEEARQLLAEIYGWFTEGFETKDLQEAKALLDALS
jgi:hypothetical protein